MEETSVTRYYREWRHEDDFNGQWYRQGKSAGGCRTRDVPFGIGGGYDTEAEAWGEWNTSRWRENRVVKVTVTQTIEPVD